MDVIKNKELAEQSHKQLQAVVDLKRQIAESEEALKATKSQISDLAEDQSRELAAREATLQSSLKTSIEALNF